MADSLTSAAELAAVVADCRKLTEALETIERISQTKSDEDDEAALEEIRNIATAALDYPTRTKVYG